MIPAVSGANNAGSDPSGAEKKEVQIPPGNFEDVQSILELTVDSGARYGDRHPQAEEEAQPTDVSGKRLPTASKSQH